ncbi:hypothetical protein [Bradyrhizobium sp. AZCC 1693]|uniref:hypothetical protein n=1 Tax=Bradyrhizobium sp. AZCC 1693 TaxID=3117029 RepID=UPI002FF005A9
MNQATRLFGFFVTFLTPMAAVTYVVARGLQNSGEDALLRVLVILTFSLLTAFVCALAQPIQAVDPVRLARLGLANVCFVVIDSLIFALLVYDRIWSGDACQSAADKCGKYPVMWLALAGMHLCYAVWAYAGTRHSSR